MAEELTAPAQPSGQGPSVEKAPASTSKTPYFEYEWEDGKKDSFASVEDLKRSYREGVLRHRDYTKKTQELAEQRKTHETERKALEATAVQVRAMESQWRPVDEFLKNRQDVYQYIQSQMRQPGPDIMARQTQNLVENKTKGIEDKLKAFEEWKEEQDLERQKRSLFDQFKKTYDDFDEDAISEELRKANETPEEDSLRSLVEMIYFARKGRETPIEIEKRIAETSSGKSQKRPPVPPGKAPKEGPTTVPRTFTEAAELYKKKHGAA